MATIGTLIINLIARTSDFENGINRSRKALLGFRESATALQNRIAGQFKTSDFASTGIAPIKKQFETRLALEDKLFSATHNYRDIALRENELYFSNLKGIWQKNEGMLTLISQTENAKRLEIDKNYSESSIRTFIRSFTGKATIVGIAAFAIVKSINQITEAHKQLEQSEKTAKDYINVWAESIPLFGRVSKAIREMIEEFSGTAEAEKRLQAVVQFTNKMADIREKLSRTLEMQNASSQKQDELKTLYDYQDTIEKIEETEKGLEPIRKRNAEILKQINVLEDAMRLDTGDYGYGTSNKNFSEQIEMLKLQLTIEQSTNTERKKALELYQMQIAALREKLAIGALITRTEAAPPLQYNMQNIERLQKVLNPAGGWLGALQKQFTNNISFESLTNAVKEVEKLNNELDAFRKSIMTPSEQFRDQMKSLVDWLNRGLISVEEFEKGMKKNHKNIFDSHDKKHPQMPEGSAKVIDYISEISISSLRLGRPKDNLEDIARKQLEESQKQTKSLQKIESQWN